MVPDTTAVRTRLLGRFGVFLLGVLLASVVFVGVAPTARACSCEGAPPDWVFGLETAFVGQQTSNELTPSGRTVTFDVERVLLGEVGETVVVRTSGPDNPCGEAWWAGNPPDGPHMVGAGTDDDGALLALGSCGPAPTLELFDELLAQDLPPPAAPGPAVALVPLRHLWADMAAVNAQGQVVGWHGGGQIQDAALCPNPELVLLRRRASLDLVDVTTMTTVGTAAADTRHGVFQHTTTCLSHTADDPSYLTATGGVNYSSPLEVVVQHDSGTRVLALDSASVVAARAANQELLWFPSNDADPVRVTDLAGTPLRDGPVLSGAVLAATVSSTGERLALLISDGPPASEPRPLRMELWDLRDGFELVGSLDTAPRSVRPPREPPVFHGSSAVSVWSETNGGTDVDVLDFAAQSSSVLELPRSGWIPAYAVIDQTVLLADYSWTDGEPGGRLLSVPIADLAVRSGSPGEVSIEHIGSSYAGPIVQLTTPREVDAALPPPPAYREPDPSVVVEVAQGQPEPATPTAISNTEAQATPTSGPISDTAADDPADDADDTAENDDSGSGTTALQVGAVVIIAAGLAWVIFRRRTL